MKGTKRNVFLFHSCPPSRSISALSFSTFFLFVSIASCRCFSQPKLSISSKFNFIFSYVVIIYILNTEIWKVIIINNLIPMQWEMNDDIIRSQDKKDSEYLPCNPGQKFHGIRFFLLYHTCGSILVPIVRCLEFYSATELYISVWE